MKRVSIETAALLCGISPRLLRARIERPFRNSLTTNARGPLGSALRSNSCTGARCARRRAEGQVRTRQN
jgi:hypothetical protein